MAATRTIRQLVLGRELLGAIASPLGIAELDLDVLAFRTTEAVQCAPESISERMRKRA
jgi:hypothetical protein